MSRTHAEFVVEYASALAERPISLKKLHAISEHAVVDLRDAPISKSKLDCPLVSCCDDMRAVNACEKRLKAITIGDLSRVGCDRLLAVRNLGRRGFVAIHDAASRELGDHLLSRDLDDECLSLALAASLVLRGDLRRKTTGWIRWSLANFKCAEHMIALRGMSGADEAEEEDEKESPLSPKMKKHLERLNEKTPTKVPQDDDI